MKNKFYLGIIVILIIMSLTVNTIAVDEPHDEKVNTDADQVGEVIELQEPDMYSLVMNKTYSVNWTVGAGKTLTGATKIFMSEGDTVTFNMSYTPTDASVKIGLLTPKNTFFKLYKK